MNERNEKRNENEKGVHERKGLLAKAKPATNKKN